MGVLKDLETFIASADRLHDDGVPSASMAILDESGRISAHVITKGRENTDTMYQASSISKAITALAVARLIDDGTLTYNTKVEPHIPPDIVASLVDARTAHLLQHVTVGMLISHRAGISQQHLPGYPSHDNINGDGVDDDEAQQPSYTQLFAGAPPANHPRIRFISFPGSHFCYSGGGLTLLQVFLEQLTDEPFAALLQRLVLQPLGMRRSRFGRPDAHNYARAHWSATHPGNNNGGGGSRSGSGGGGQRGGRGYNSFRELAAAGLWTTPTDLLRAVTAVQRSLEPQRRQDDGPMLTPGGSSGNGNGGSGSGSGGGGGGNSNSNSSSNTSTPGGGGVGGGGGANPTTGTSSSTPTPTSPSPPFLSLATARAMLTLPADAQDSPPHHRMAQGWFADAQAFGHSGDNEPGYTAYVFGTHGGAVNQESHSSHTTSTTEAATQTGEATAEAAQQEPAETRIAMAVMTNSRLGFMTCRKLVSAVLAFKDRTCRGALPGYGAQGDFVPYAAPEGIYMIREFWQDWVGRWSGGWEILEDTENGAMVMPEVLFGEGVEPMRMRAGAAPGRLANGFRESTLVVDGLEVALRLTMDMATGERIVVLVQGGTTKVLHRVGVGR